MASEKETDIKNGTQDAPPPYRPSSPTPTYHTVDERAPQHHDTSTSLPRLNPDECQWKRPQTTTLHDAARAGYVNVVKYLLSSRLEVDFRTRYGSTPLQLAAQRGHTAVVTTLLDHDANVNGKDFYQRSVLHYAISSGDTKLLGLLIDRGADVHAKNLAGNNALEMALLETLPEMAVFLMEKGATIREDLKNSAMFRNYWDLGIQGWPSHPP
ncbi:ankyrin repeat-containing domain protein [Aspergillus cavernicola]|uniref:Ankyrin repeat-containing domain protein n=1 Tax=Aspergillus cavernicola TaxID=176166 RepID=A0ABR4HUX5_9EURO